MNKLSVMLWLSDVLPSLAIFACVVGVLAGIAAVPATCLGIFLWTDHDREKETFEKMRLRSALAAKVLFPLSVILLAVAILMPSKTTVIAIAASEAAEMVVTSEAGQEVGREALAAVRAWLRDQVEGRKK